MKHVIIHVYPAAEATPAVIVGTYPSRAAASAEAFELRQNHLGDHLFHVVKASEAEAELADWHRVQHIKSGDPGPALLGACFSLGKRR